MASRGDGLRAVLFLALGVAALSLPLYLSTRRPAARAAAAPAGAHPATEDAARQAVESWLSARVRGEAGSGSWRGGKGPADALAVASFAYLSDRAVDGWVAAAALRGQAPWRLASAIADEARATTAAQRALGVSMPPDAADPDPGYPSLDDLRRSLDRARASFEQGQARVDRLREDMSSAGARSAASGPGADAALFYQNINELDVRRGEIAARHEQRTKELQAALASLERLAAEPAHLEARAFKYAIATPADAPGAPPQVWTLCAVRETDGWRLVDAAPAIAPATAAETR